MPNGQEFATPKQLAYIESLTADCKKTVAKPLEELTKQEASEIIDEMLETMNGGENGNEPERNVARRKRYDSWSKGARIGLAFKVCFMQWVSSDINIFKNKEQFMKNVVDTYNLLSEIAEKAEAA